MYSFVPQAVHVHYYATLAVDRTMTALPLIHAHYYGAALGSATQKRVVGGVSGRMGGIEGLGGGSIISFVLILPIC